MNARIKKLAEQAGIEFTYDPTETPMRAFVECWEDEMEKFAELIVKECIGILEKEIVLEMDRMLTSANETDEALHANKVRHFTSLAAKSYAHFGVGE